MPTALMGRGLGSQTAAHLKIFHPFDDNVALWDTDNGYAITPSSRNRSYSLFRVTMPEGPIQEYQRRFSVSWSNLIPLTLAIGMRPGAITEITIEESDGTLILKGGGPANAGELLIMHNIRGAKLFTELGAEVPDTFGNLEFPSNPFKARLRPGLRHLKLVAPNGEFLDYTINVDIVSAKTTEYYAYVINGSLLAGEFGILQVLPTRFTFTMASGGSRFVLIDSNQKLYLAPPGNYSVTFKWPTGQGADGAGLPDRKHLDLTKSIKIAKSVKTVVDLTGDLKTWPMPAGVVKPGLPEVPEPDLDDEPQKFPTAILLIAAAAAGFFLIKNKKSKRGGKKAKSTGLLAKLFGKVK